MTRPAERTPLWLLATGVAVLIAAALTVLAVFGGRTLPERTGPPIEELAVERTVLAPGTIALQLRNTGPDPVQVAQVVVNDSFVAFSGGEEPVGRLGSTTLTLRYPWLDGQPYLVGLLTSTGLVIEHEIPAAVATPEPGSGFVWLMVLLGLYVGVIPVLLGMLVLPVLRRSGPRVIRFLLALTLGLLVFLAVDAAADGLELASGAGAAFGGPLVVVLGAALAFLLLTLVDRIVARRRADRGVGLALSIAIGIGVHNLGEGLAIGSAYAVGELALGVALVVGFALHNTTEGLAIVTPLSNRPASLPLLVGLGAIAGVPAVAGALVGATVDNPTLAAFLLGVGVGAIAQVVVQVAPSLRPEPGRAPDPAALVGIAAGLLVMYGTGLLVAA